jgi:hypothetical protein
MFTALGVTFNIGSLHFGMSFVSNSQKRTADMIHLLEEVLAELKLTRKHSEVLRGKLQFVESNLFGKIGKSLYTHLFRTDRPSSTINDQDVSVINQLIVWLREARPRKLSPLPHTVPVLIFTDGACEPSQQALPNTTCGALLVNNNVSDVIFRRQLFGLRIPDDIVEVWAAQDKQQLVTEAELSGVYLALNQWAGGLAHHRVLLFVDSEPAMFSLIRGTSNSPSCAEIVRKCHRLIELFNLFVWFVRIPSKSNPADGPSRLLIHESAQQFGAAVVECTLPNFF